LLGRARLVQLSSIETVSVLSAMKERMEAAGWSMGDIVMMRVYLVGDEATGGRLDFAGFMAGYSEFFATPEQPNKPARAVMEVAGLIRPGWRVEIEAQAARMPAAE
jgi:enamine deaminase RidA (YjgF/YER057c/UK114 family)